MPTLFHNLALCLAATAAWRSLEGYRYYSSEVPSPSREEVENGAKWNHV